MPQNFSGQNLRGRSFKNQDLTGANFSYADIRGANFTRAKLVKANFSHAKAGLQNRWTIVLLLLSLFLSALSGFISGVSSLYITFLLVLFLDRVEKITIIPSLIILIVLAVFFNLLVTGNGYKKSYVGENLKGVNLTGVNLNGANLKKADLSEAILQKAHLERANLTKAQAIGTDFTNAYLTGACLEALNIDSTTKLEKVHCRYVYLLEYPDEKGNRERRPHDPDTVFEAGDFEKLYKK